MGKRQQKVWHVKQWRERFEPDDTRRRGRRTPLQYAKLHVAGDSRVIDRQQVEQEKRAIVRKGGPELWAIWTWLIMAAADRREFRGYFLTHTNKPANARQIAELIGMDLVGDGQVKKALEALSGPEIDLIEQVAADGVWDEYKENAGRDGEELHRIWLDGTVQVLGTSGADGGESVGGGQESQTDGQKGNCRGRDPQEHEQQDDTRAPSVRRSAFAHVGACSRELEQEQQPRLPAESGLTGNRNENSNENGYGGAETPPNGTGDTDGHGAPPTPPDGNGTADDHGNGTEHASDADGCTDPPGGLPPDPTRPTTPAAEGGEAESPASPDPPDCDEQPGCGNTRPACQGDPDTQGSDSSGGDGGDRDGVDGSGDDRGGGGDLGNLKEPATPAAEGGEAETPASPVPPDSSGVDDDAGFDGGPDPDKVAKQPAIVTDPPSFALVVYSLLGFNQQKRSPRQRHSDEAAIANRWEEVLQQFDQAGVPEPLVMEFAGKRLRHAKALGKNRTFAQTAADEDVDIFVKYGVRPTDPLAAQRVNEKARVRIWMSQTKDAAGKFADAHMTAVEISDDEGTE